MEKIKHKSLYWIWAHTKKSLIEGLIVKDDIEYAHDNVIPPLDVRVELLNCC